MKVKHSQCSTDSINELIQLVAYLRDPQKGCPWDIEQNHSSLIPYLLEEAHEVAHAIRSGNEKNLKEELGDLLLQIIMHAQIGHEARQFDIEDIVKAINKKLIRRHPHVFSNKKATDSKAVKKIWNAVKDSETITTNTNCPISDLLENKIRSQPALSGAMIISKKVAEEGFEWDDINGVWEKVDEEIQELKDAISKKDYSHAEKELGDVFFALVNIARWCELSIEEGLQGTNNRFLQRFSYLEKSLEGKVSDKTSSQLRDLWQDAKINT